METSPNVYNSSGVTKMYLLKGRHVWRIENFSHFRDKYMIVGQTFTIGEGEHKSEWRLELLPNGENIDSDEVSLFACLISAKGEKLNKVCVNKLAILGSDQTELYATTNDHYEKLSKGDGMGEQEFIKHEKLFNKENNLLTNNQLLLLCEITIAISCEAVPDELSHVKLPECKLLEGISWLYESRKLCDITLCAQGKEVPAHKLILAAGSPVFTSMFEVPMKEKEENRVEITDVKHEVLEEMVQFLYTGKSPNLDKMADDLLVAADKYMLDRLKAMCEENLVNKVCADNVGDLWILADQHSAKHLKDKIKEFASANPTSVLMLLNK